MSRSVNDITEKFDIREYKKALRKKYKAIRMEMPENVKHSKDMEILGRVASLSAYRSCQLLLTYVSTGIEVDTTGLISTALASGKTVAVPKCDDDKGKMTFYVISSFDDLEPGYFSVLEPVPEKCRKVKDFDGAFCVVPSLAYDRDGYRLGYGKGYYDRFLSAHPEIFKVGIEYCCCMETCLIHGKFDVPSDIVVTEKYIKNCGKERSSDGKQGIHRR